jgi:superfamily II DNA or RNA helicase
VEPVGAVGGGVPVLAPRGVVTVVVPAVTSYADFIEKKLRNDPETGFEPLEISDALYPFQRDLTEWSLRRGRAAIFADCGLGKTPMQLEWAHRVCQETRGDVLILAPLAVSAQTAREGDKFSVPVTVCREPGDIRAGVNITNYDRLERFARHDWKGVVLDESSILKAFDGKTRGALIAWAQRFPYRLCCTATPSPNDYMELGGHADFLGVLSHKQMLAEFFVNDGISAGSWRLKGHAREAYWRWISEWARALRSPADLGYDDRHFDLPPLNVETIQVDADAVSEDRLFAVPVATMSERRQARRESIPERVAIAEAIVNGSSEPWVVWCDLNAESEALARAIPDSVEVRGSDHADIKEERLIQFSTGEARVIVTKPSIAGWGLNWQHCANVLFVGLSDSYEQYYQAVRRCWRFGQTNPVRVVIVASNREQAVLENVRRKERQAMEMFAEIVQVMHG